MLTTLVELVLMGAAVATASMTISKGKIFRPIRRGISEKTFFGDLVRCPYCMSHWIALMAVMWSRPVLFANKSDFVSSWIVPCLALVAIAAPFSWIIYKAYSGPEEEE